MPVPVQCDKLIGLCAKNTENCIRVCFSLVFGAAVFGMIRTGVDAIDRGQLEAAYTLGYSDLKAFFRGVFPSYFRGRDPRPVTDRKDHDDSDA